MPPSVLLKLRHHIDKKLFYAKKAGEERKEDSKENYDFKLVFATVSAINKENDLFC